MFSKSSLFLSASACPLMKKRKQDEETGSEPSPKKRIKELQTCVSGAKGSRENSPANRDKNTSQINGIPSESSPEKSASTPTSKLSTVKVMGAKMGKKKLLTSTSVSPKKAVTKPKESDDSETTSKLPKLKQGPKPGSPEKGAGSSPKRTGTPPAKKKSKDADAAAAGSPPSAKPPKSKKRPDLQTIKNAKLKQASGKIGGKETRVAMLKKGKESGGGKSGKQGKGTDIDEDDDSTDLDEDRKNIREAERALRSLSGEWEGSPPFFTSYDR